MVIMIIIFHGHKKMTLQINGEKYKIMSGIQRISWLVIYG